GLELAEIARGGCHVRRTDAHRRGGRLDQPYQPAAMRGEVGADRRRVCVPARADEGCADLHVPERRWFLRRGRWRLRGRGSGKCQQQEEQKRAGTAHVARRLQPAYPHNWYMHPWHDYPVDESRIAERFPVI